jgi:phosphoribosylamine--glycine ligase
MDFDFAEVLADVAAARLDAAKLKWRPGASVCLVLASGGYPGKFLTGKRIEGLADAGRIPEVKVLHASTTRRAAPGSGVELVTSGGRVLGVTATGASLDAALASAYRGAGEIHFEGMHYRRDIGGRAAAWHGRTAV